MFMDSHCRPQYVSRTSCRSISRRCRRARLSGAMFLLRSFIAAIAAGGNPRAKKDANKCRASIFPSFSRKGMCPTERFLHVLRVSDGVTSHVVVEINIHIEAALQPFLDFHDIPIE